MRRPAVPRTPSKPIIESTFTQLLSLLKLPLSYFTNPVKGTNYLFTDSTDEVVKIRDYTGNLIPLALTIPQPKIEVSKYSDDSTPAPKNHVLKIRWESANNIFLKFNPEVWLFVYNIHTKKWVTSVGMSPLNHRLIKNKWTHPAHLNGSKYLKTNPKYFCGKTILKAEDGTELLPDGIHTEWPLVSDTMNMMTVPFNFYEWYYLLDDGHGSGPILIDDSIDLRGVFGYIRCRGKGKIDSTHPYLTKEFKLAIVIDNPNKQSDCPKLFGPLSESFYAYHAQANDNFEFRKKVYRP